MLDVGLRLRRLPMANLPELVLSSEPCSSAAAASRHSELPELILPSTMSSSSELPGQVLLAPSKPGVSVMKKPAAARAVKRAAASSSVPKQKKARSDHKKNVRVFGGDFSGLEVAIEAMQEVANGAACHIEVQHAFSSDVDPSCRRSFLFLGCNQTEL